MSLVKRRTWLDHVKLWAARTHAGVAMRRFQRAIDDAVDVQNRLFEKLVLQAPASDFQRHFGFDRIRTYSDYASGVPIQRYADISPYIERVRNGEVEALFARGTRLLMFALTSGTTAEPKYIPITPCVLNEWRDGWSVWGLRALLDHHGSFLRGIVQITSPMNDHLAPGGAPCGAITGLLAATQRRLVRRYYTAPLAVADIRDAAAKYYTIMRLSIFRDVAFMVTASPATLLLLARAADDHREQIIRDIHDGALWADLPVSRETRAALAPHMPARPDAARRLEGCVRENGGLYPRNYWRLGFLAHWTGGTMGLYLPLLKKYFGDVPSRDIGLLASEGRLSIPDVDATASGILNVRSHFFEFIPADEYGTDRPTVLRMHELRQGCEYFVLLTNGSGLYRYDLGDRVRVTGLRGQAPLIEFLSRDAHTSSMAGEKLTEDQVVTAMRGLATGSKSVVDFVLAPQFGERPYYRLYLEGREAGQWGDLAARFDAALSAANVEYAGKRESGRLGCVQLAELTAGTLSNRDKRLRENRSRTSEQFKHQFLLPRPGLDAELEAAMMPSRRPAGPVRDVSARIPASQLSQGT